MVSTLVITIRTPRQIKRANIRLIRRDNHPATYRPFRANGLFCGFRGLKPWAESCCRFGSEIASNNPALTLDVSDKSYYFSMVTRQPTEDFTSKKEKGQ
jgi:hypothetical protein